MIIQNKSPRKKRHIEMLRIGEGGTLNGAAIFCLKSRNSPVTNVTFIKLQISSFVLAIIKSDLICHIILGIKDTIQA
jgi:hypothetical protein